MILTKSGTIWVIAAVAAMVGLGGCSGPAADSATTGEPAKVEKPAETPKPAAAELPANLKTTGAEYYGVSNPELLTYEVTDASGKKNDGTQQGALSPVDDKSAKFVITRKDIVNPGESKDEISVRPDGVFAVATGGQSFSNPPMELPAEPTAGKKWQIDTEVTASGVKAKMTGTLTVVGMEKVKTAAGEFDTLVVSLQGTIKLKDQTQAISGKSWYAKGVGLIKQELVQKQSGTEMKNTTVLKKRGA